MSRINTIWAESALLGDRWAENVQVEVDPLGNIGAIREAAPYASGERVAVLLPAIPNLHSHAHQRAMAGLGERAGDSADSFWTWRKVMYHYLERIEPDDLRAIAAQLYLEMLKSGYGSVAEFQYLHHDSEGRAYDNRAEMTLQCLEAARQTGIGFTALPVLYRYGGFGGAEPLEAQKRFLNNDREFTEIVESIKRATANDANSTVGIAPHSLRAIDADLLSSVCSAVGEIAAIHIHVAEQTREVDDCIAWSGRRPVEWLFEHFEVGENWCLVHATHIDDAEIAAMAGSGCIAGLCPTTEANLGDGFFRLLDYRELGGRWAIGSDSHISIDPVEELRWLEYGLRLQTRQRNLMASALQPSTGRNLFDAAVESGARACGRACGGIESGRRADFVVLDTGHPRLYGRHRDELIDSWIFSGNERLVRDVYVGGAKVVDNGRHAHEAEIERDFRAALDRLSS